MIPDIKYILHKVLKKETFQISTVTRNFHRKMLSMTLSLQKLGSGYVTKQ